jgi:hypothetical protein
VQPGAAASMSIEMSAPSMEAIDMQDCGDGGGGMSGPSCMTVCASACVAILNQAAKANPSPRVSHALILALRSFGVVRTPDPSPPRQTA